MTDDPRNAGALDPVRPAPSLLQMAHDLEKRRPRKNKPVYHPPEEEQTASPRSGEAVSEDRFVSILETLVDVNHQLASLVAPKQEAAPSTGRRPMDEATGLPMERRRGAAKKAGRSPARVAALPDHDQHDHENGDPPRDAPGKNISLIDQPRNDLVPAAPKETLATAARDLVRSPIKGVLSKFSDIARRAAQVPQMLESVQRARAGEAPHAQRAAADHQPDHLDFSDDGFHDGDEASPPADGSAFRHEFERAASALKQQHETRQPPISEPFSAAPDAGRSQSAAQGYQEYYEAERPAMPGPVHFSPLLIHNWGSVVADLSFQSGERHIEIETVDARARFEPRSGYIQAAGSIGSERFGLLLDADFTADLARSFDPQADFPPRSTTDAALVLEHLLTPFIERLEQFADRRITLMSAEWRNTPYDGPVLPLRLMMNGRAYEAALAPGSWALEQITRGVQFAAQPAEQGVDDQAYVVVGPILLGAMDTMLAPGEIIECGVNPAGEVHGMLRRSDDRFWPIQFEGDQVLVTGPLQEPLVDEPDGRLASLAIGMVMLSRMHRVRMAPGHRLEFQRVPGNGALMRISDGPDIPGELELIDGVLAFKAQG